MSLTNLSSSTIFSPAVLHASIVPVTRVHEPYKLKQVIKKLALRKGRGYSPAVPPSLNCTLQHNSTHAIIQSLITAPPGNGEVFRSVCSLTLTGGFDAVPVSRLALSPGSLLGSAIVY